MSEIKLLDINLKLFDGGAGAGAGASTGGDGGASTGTSDAGATQTTQADLSMKNGSSRRSGRSRMGELSNVVYGKQDTTEDNSDAKSATSKTDVTTTSDTLEARRSAFEELINGEYKDLFTERTQSIIDRRFKETKNYEARLNSQQPVIDMLMSKYKITDGDISKLTEAIDKDDTYWEEAAEEAGLTVEQYKQVQKLQRENEAFRKAQMAALDQRQKAAKINRIAQQANELKALYPEFDLRTELANPEFAKMVNNDIPLRQAYEVMHIDEMVNGAARTAAQRAEQNTVAKIKSKSSRPTENGTSSASGAVIKSDVKSLTKADRAEIARRAARGERISF